MTLELISFLGGCLFGAMVFAFIDRYRVDPVVMGARYALSRLIEVRAAIIEISATEVTREEATYLAYLVIANAVDQVESGLDKVFSVDLLRVMSKLGSEHIEAISQLVYKEAASFIGRLGSRRQRRLRHMREILKKLGEGVYIDEDGK